MSGTAMSSTALATLARRAAVLADLLPCRSDPALWFSESPSDLELARASCRRCPLRAECLAGAIERAEPWGVWGGEIFDKGAIIARKRPRGRPPRHLSDQAGLRSVLPRQGERPDGAVSLRRQPMRVPGRRRRVGWRWPLPGDTKGM